MSTDSYEDLNMFEGLSDNSWYDTNVAAPLCDVCGNKDAIHTLNSGCYCDGCYYLLEDELELLDSLDRFEKFKHASKRPEDAATTGKKKKTPRKKNKYDDYTYDQG